MKKRKLECPFSESEDSADNEESDEEDNDQDSADLARVLFKFANDPIVQGNGIIEKEHRQRSYSAVLRAIAVMLELREDLKNILNKSKKRRDGKVPPGSNQVKRSLSDDRFFLCACCSLAAKISEMVDDYAQAMEHWREALIWFPRSIEANYRLGLSIRSTASTSQELEEVEQLWKKAVSSAKQLKDAPMQEINDLYEEILSDSNIRQGELEAGDSATESLILLLCQANKLDQATPLLMGRNYKWRLAEQVLNYPMPLAPPSCILGSHTSGSVVASQFVQVFDNVIKEKRLLTALRQVFRPQGPFWREHDYDAMGTNCSRSVGYFSYLFPFRERRAGNVVERAIEEIFAVASAAFPHVRDRTTIAEWWVHSRPHSSGHQLHFDSDETDISDGKPPHHPLVSCVLYLSNGDEDDEPNDGAIVGGPTIVTNQTLRGGSLASEGWLCHGRPNRLAIFDAQYLHGVLPGKGTVVSKNSRRLTFMVGFWDTIASRPRGKDHPGPGQPLPDVCSTSYTWPQEMVTAIQSLPIEGNKWDPATSSDILSTVSSVDPIHLQAIWEPVQEASSTSNSLNSLKSAPPYYACYQGF